MHLSDYLQIRNSYETPPLEAWNEVDPTDPLSLAALQATANGDVVGLAAVLDQGIKVDSRFDFALWETVNPNEKAIIIRTKKKFFRADDTKPISITLLHAAAKRNQVAVIRLLLERGAGVDLVNRLPYDLSVITALFDAIANGNLDAARCLLEAGATPNVEGWYHGCRYTSLAVCLLGWFVDKSSSNLDIRAEIFRLLLDHSADVKYQPYPCESSMQAAVRCNRVDIVQELLRRGASYEHALSEFVRGSGSKRLLDHLVANGACDIDLAMSGEYSYSKAQTNAASQLLDRFPSFIGSPNSYMAFSCAARRGDINMLGLFVRRGLDVNTTEHLGLTPLSAAIQSGRLPAVKWLLAKGADVNLRNKPYNQTVPDSRQEYIYILTGTTTNTLTPLHIATFEWNQDIVECLLDAGADVKAHSRGVTPLITMCTRGMQYACFEQAYISRAVGTLVRAGADINMTIGRGFTPLQVVAHLSGPDIHKAVFARALLEHGANPYAGASKRKLPAHLALSRYNSASTPLIIDVLVEHTSDYEYVIGLMENDLR